METKLYDGWKTARKQWTVNLFFCKATCQTIVYYQSPSSLTSFYLSLFPKIAPSQSNLRFPNELLYLWRFPFFFILLKTRSYCFNLALSRCILFINELPNVSKTYPLFFLWWCAPLFFDLTKYENCCWKRLLLYFRER